MASAQPSLFDLPDLPPRKHVAAVSKAVYLVGENATHFLVFSGESGGRLGGASERANAHLTPNHIPAVRQRDMADHDSISIEVWRPVYGWEGEFEISSHGRLRRLNPTLTSRPRIMGGSRPRQINWYCSVELRANGRRQCTTIHRIVARAFIGPAPIDRPDVNHIDGNKQNNRPENLEYVSPGENNRHANQTGLNPVHCEHNPSAKLTNDQVLQLRADYQSGLSINELVQRYAVSPTGVCRIIQGQKWSALGLGDIRRPTIHQAVAAAVALSEGLIEKKSIMEALRGAKFLRSDADSNRLRNSVGEALRRLSRSGHLIRISPLKYYKADRAAAS